MTISVGQLLSLIVLVPLLGAVINGFLGKRYSARLAHWVGVGSALVSFVLALRAVLSLEALAATQPYQPAFAKTVYSWVVSGMFQLDVAFYLDPLSAVLLLVVTGVGLLIHVYSTGYLGDDPASARYFAYMNLFVCSMLVLVLGKNLFMMFVGWQGVGLSSYLLAGFWFRDDANAQAGQKAFMINRVGDVGFLIGLILLLFHTKGTTDFDVLRWACESGGVTGVYGPFHDPHTLLACCLLLFVGVCTKAAQIPLHGWLCGSTAGPTPATALMCATSAAVVGVYTLVRLDFLYTLSPIVMDVVAIVGGATALIGALIALTQRDIKKVLAYATVSQVGYMILAVGLGAYVAGVFHLITHACVIALLFLCVGTVTRGLAGERDIFKMGGIKSKFPVTRWAFLVGVLAIAGLPLLSSSFSQNAVLWETQSRKQLLPIPAEAEAGYSDGKEMWLGGRYGAVLHGSGEFWEQEQVPPTDRIAGDQRLRTLPALNALTVDEEGGVWAAAAYGTVYRKEEGTWRRYWQDENGGGGRAFAGIWATASEAWTVGSNGWVLHCQSERCETVDTGVMADLSAVTARSADEVYVGGAGGTLLKWNGSEWTRITATSSQKITSLAFVGDTLYAATEGGALNRLGPVGLEKLDVRAEGITQLLKLTAIGTGTDTLYVAGLGRVEGEIAPRSVVLRHTEEGPWVASIGAPVLEIAALGVVEGTTYGTTTRERLLVGAAPGTLQSRGSVPHKPWYHVLLFFVACAGIALTAFYMLRLYFVTFEGRTRCSEEVWTGAHEGSFSMVAPVVVLGTLSVISGWWGPELASWLEPVLRISDGRLQSVPQEGSMLWEPVLASVLGVLLAAGLYARSSAPVKASPPPSPKVPRTVFIRALQTLSSFFHSWVEVFLIKRTLVGGPALLVSRIGRVVRGPEAGSVQQYLVVVTVLAGAALLLYMGL